MVDLKELAKTHRLRTTWDESFHAERPEFRREVAGKLVRIPCDGDDFIKPYGDHLAAYVASGNRHGFEAKLSRFLAIPTAKRLAVGELDGFIAFDVADLDAVAKMLGARRKRVLTPEQREKALATLAASRNRGLEAIRLRRTGDKLVENHVVQGETVCGMVDSTVPSVDLLPATCRSPVL
jgi:hypothetical protein